MKILIIALLLGACATTRSFRGPDGELAFETTCNGTARTFADCYQRASYRCPDGYIVLDKDASTGGFTHNGQWYTTQKRSIMYRCE